MSETGSSPSEMLAQYKEMVRTHPEQVKRMEEMGRLVTMLVPTTRLGKYSEVFQEATYSVLSLVSLYHSRIIHQVRLSEQNTPLAWLVKLVLTLFGQTEVVIEMLTRIIRGDDARMRIVIFIEWFKAICRLALFSQSGRRSIIVAGGQLQPLPPGGEAVAANGSASSEATVADAQSSPASPGEVVEQGTTEATLKNKPQWVGRRSGKAVPLSASLASHDNVNDAPLVANATAAAGAKTLALSEAGPEDQALRTAGEVLHIMRPVIYVMQMRHKSAQKSWTPWVVSLLLELLSLRCSSVATPGPVVKQTESANSAEVMTLALQKLVSGSSGSSKLPPAAAKVIDDELRRRRTLFSFYFMRSPVFDLVTLPAVRRFAKSLSHLPGLGNNIEKMLVEMVMYYHRNHFHIAGS
ncbi:Peroxisome biosis protein 16 [Hondaea fermentalgiana]|uniref:Peroxisomal membrane protein PEX16 n=1 Tax=Hondaea fermentalgiana TaxID=2315210 RepID=A0A2R5GG66_9STRA|nr:Peroxisome biosis protein 16 [Hondaea fermentalgiana]|eukprot:GBG29877.1 Peroxisome biosis protein 16 [Hondaea fermentalgiana]